MDAVVPDLLSRTRQGDDRAREELIAEHLNFIGRVASRYCRRPLDWNNDDELSIGLMAFNEAIDSYNPQLGTPFLSHASTVIHHRLVDWFRRQPDLVPLSLDGATDEDEESAASLEAGPALVAYERDQEALDRADDLTRYDQALDRFGTSLAELGQICPRHRDTRASLQQAAARLTAQPDLMRTLTRTGQLPMKQMEALTGLSRKVLDSGRKYIIAVALVLWGDEFSHLKSFIELEDAEGDGPISSRSADGGPDGKGGTPQ